MILSILISFVVWGAGGGNENKKYFWFGVTNGQTFSPLVVKETGHQFGEDHFRGPKELTRGRAPSQGRIV